MSKTELGLLIQRICTDAAHDDGSFELSEVTDRLTDALRANPELMDPEKVARDEVKRFDRARRPKIEQPSFFDADALVPTGESRRVRMEDATQVDLTLWNGVLLDQFQAQQEAYMRSVRWIQARFEEFGQNRDCKTVGDLQRRQPPSSLSA